MHMANKIPIEEQVAKLTEEQQNKIIKVGKIATVALLVGGIPWFIMSALGIWVLLCNPTNLGYAEYDALFKGLIVWMFLGALYMFGVSAFAKLKCPYYSDAKCRYLLKTRKQK